MEMFSFMQRFSGKCQTLYDVWNQNFTFNMSAASYRIYTYLHICTWKYFTEQFIYRIFKNLRILTDQLEISCLVNVHYSAFICLYPTLVVGTMPKGYDLTRIWAVKCRKRHHTGFRNPSVLLMQIILQYWKNWLLWTSLYDYHRSCLISILGWLWECFSVGNVLYISPQRLVVSLCQIWDLCPIAILTVPLQQSILAWWGFICFFCGKHTWHRNL